MLEREMLVINRLSTTAALPLLMHTTPNTDRPTQSILKNATTAICMHAFRVCLLVLCTNTAAGDSAIDLISGFDQARLEKAYPPTGPEGLNELCKLLYRLRNVDESRLQRIATASPASTIGDAVQDTGKLTDLKRVLVPATLQEYLGFESIYFLEIERDSRPFLVITSRVPPEAQAGDRIDATGILLSSAEDSKTKAIACGEVGWFANRPMSSGEKLLLSQNFNMSLLAGLATRNRLPLTPSDGDAFYTMLATAHQIASLEELPSPTFADPVTFLRDGKNSIAQWVQMEVEGVQITKIAVSSPERQAQLGSDHYYQIDAIGDLGEVVVKIEGVDEQEPVEFKTRYPVSIAVRELPAFLSKGATHSREYDGSIVRPLRGKLLMTGFFFRLWSYESEFMQQKGAKEQFGPLLIAAAVENLEPTSVKSIGVEKIGSFAALAMICGILGIWLWQRATDRRDDQAKQKRMEQQAQNVSFDLPTNLNSGHDSGSDREPQDEPS